MAAFSVLLVGARGSGKTSVVRRLLGGSFQQDVRPTVGIDENSGRISVSPEQVSEHPDLVKLLPRGGIVISFVEIGGRELREPPRGQPVDAVLLCYDGSDRSSFQRAATVLCTCRLDAHHRATLYESAVRRGPDVQRHVPVVLCRTKADLPGGPAVTAEEVATFLEVHAVRGSVATSARSGDGLQDIPPLLAMAILEADAELDRELTAAALEAARPSATAWSLPTRPGAAVGEAAAMTSPRGTRPHEPERGATGCWADGLLAGDRLVDVLGDGPSAPRTVVRCLQHGLLHRAVHVWICVPRTGALLFRKWSPSALKHPGAWGPSCHGEVLSYGLGGDGHAAELSGQAAARLLGEQLGVEAASFGELEHWFSSESTDGLCRELVDVYVAALEGSGLPTLRLEEGEEVDWVYFARLFGDEVSQLGLLCHFEGDYRRAMTRRLRQGTVREDVLYAFGEVAVAADAALATK